MAEDTPSPLRRIVLVGMMGVGKTAVGTAVAARLGWRYWDNDVELQRDTGRDARTLVAELGVAAAHAEETRVLLQALALDEPAVVGAAGSVVDDPVALRALQGEWVVWLRASVETLLQRVRSDHHRPFMDEDVAVTLHRLDAERHEQYQRIAAAVVDVDGRSVAESAALVLQAREAALSRS